MSLFVKLIKILLSFYLVRILREILSSDLVLRNNFYANLARNRSLTKVAKYESKFKNSIVPSSLEIELTNRCNLNCVFCPNAVHQRKRGTMTFGTFKDIVNGAKQLNPRPDIIISGFGECLLDSEITIKLDYLKQVTQMNVSLVTNGALFTKELIEDICKKELVHTIYVSIDASDKNTYKEVHSVDLFDKVLENLTLIYERKQKDKLLYPKVIVRYKDLLSQKNGFKRFTRIFYKISDEITTFANIFVWPESGMDIGICHNKKLIKIACPNLWMGMRINWNGDVVLCCQDYEGRVVLGNVNDQTLIKIWNNKTIHYYRKCHTNFSFKQLRICKECDINTHLVIPF